MFHIVAEPVLVHEIPAESVEAKSTVIAVGPGQTGLVVSVIGPTMLLESPTPQIAVT